MQSLAAPQGRRAHSDPVIEVQCRCASPPPPSGARMAASVEADMGSANRGAQPIQPSVADTSTYCDAAVGAPAMRDHKPAAARGTHAGCLIIQSACLAIGCLA
jgi:hypothetical protein